MVRYTPRFWHSGTGLSTRVGSPPIAVEELEPLLPDRAGVSIGFMSYIRLILLFLPRIHRMMANRPAAAVERVQSVREILPLESTILTCPQYSSLLKSRQRGSIRSSGVLGKYYGLDISLLRVPLTRLKLLFRGCSRLPSWCYRPVPKRSHRSSWWYHCGPSTCHQSPCRLGMRRRCVCKSRCFVTLSAHEL